MEENSKKYLSLLSKSFKNIDEVTTEIINLQSILNLPKGTELFIGNLNIETKEEELYELFKKYGEIIDVRIKNNI